MIKLLVRKKEKYIEKDKRFGEILNDVIYRHIYIYIYDIIYIYIYKYIYIYIYIKKRNGYHASYVIPIKVANLNICAEYFA